MNIWLLFSFIFGSLVKAYDEIVDNNLKINIYLLYLLQICIIILSILLCNVDILTTFFLSSLSLLYFLNIYFNFLMDKPLDTYFYIICAFICIGLFIKNINKISFKYIIMIIYMLILTIIENYISPEEYSIFKLIYRIILLFIFIISLFINNYFFEFNNIIITMIGYILTWIIFKQYITNKYVNLIDVYSYIWKKLKKIYKKLKTRKMIKLLQKIRFV